LYEALRPAVAPLVVLLSDDEEKTRANAAGALGNLVRNSGQLCGEIIQVSLCGTGKCLLQDVWLWKLVAQQPKVVRRDHPGEPVAGFQAWCGQTRSLLGGLVQ
jgi:hypothetical protein